MVIWGARNARAMRDRCVGLKGGFSTNACLLWLSYLDPTTRYFEWGSGFTTTVADKAARSVVSIEGSREWYDKMTTQHAFSSRTLLRYVDIGPTGSFSWPKNSTTGRRYIDAVKEYPAQDVILVDGRWRVACATAAFTRLNAGGRILVHDFSRKHYHVLLSLYTMENETDTLVVLKPKADVSHAALHRLGLQFQNDASR